jgi:lysophospholipase L1-like esterase
VLGDSLAEESMQYVHLLTSEKEFRPHFFGGTAPCDWLDRDVDASKTSIVIITFTGNSQTPCMADDAGGFLAGEELVDKYESDVRSLVEKARDDGAHVILVGQPSRRDDVGGNDEVEALNAVYRDVADDEFVSFVDAGAAVENADGSYAQDLPCVPDEPECEADGSNTVRNDDGLHFCPGGPHGATCPTYASGAWRFAVAVVDAIEDPAVFENA